MAEVAKQKTEGVSVVEVSDYIYGNYKGKLTSPPNADLNPKKAFVVFWKDARFRFIFAHEQSYCPFFDSPGGAGVSFEFFESDAGYELLNQYGRRERNSFVDVIESGPKRVWIRWSYFGVRADDPQPNHRGSEDYWFYPNGLILRRQTCHVLRVCDAHEPIELIGMCPVGKRWFDVLQKGRDSEERHALAVLDAFSSKRYDLYWTPKPGAAWDSTQRRSGCTWKEVDDASGVALVFPLKEGAAFCILGDASGFRHDYTRLVNHTYKDYEGPGCVWGSASWDHWPIGWLNSQAALGRREFVTALSQQFFAGRHRTFSHSHPPRCKSGECITASTVLAATTWRRSARSPADGWRKERRPSSSRIALLIYRYRRLFDH